MCCFPSWAVCNFERKFKFVCNGSLCVCYWLWPFCEFWLRDWCMKLGEKQLKKTVFCLFWNAFFSINGNRNWLNQWLSGVFELDMMSEGEYLSRFWVLRKCWNAWKMTHFQNVLCQLKPFTIQLAKTVLKTDFFWSDPNQRNTNF